jgi:hypothetical protein
MLNFGTGIFSLILSIMYLKISIKTSGSVMRKALFLFIGVILISGSYVVFILEEFGISKELIALISFSLSTVSIPFLILGYK